MERGSTTKWLLLGLAIFLLMTKGREWFTGPKAILRQPLLDDETAAVVGVRAPEETCTLDAPRFQAELSTYGASLRHLYLKDRQYTRPIPVSGDLLGSIGHLVAGNSQGSPTRADLVSTTRPSQSPLRVDLRAPTVDATAQQVPYDDLDWKLAASDGKSCTFTYTDATTSVQKVVALGADPFELTTDVTVRNLAPVAKKHRFTIEQDSYRMKSEMEGHLGRQSELVTRSVAITTTKSDFETAGDFTPGDFTPKKGFTPEHWRRSEGEAKLAAVSSVYFTRALAPEAGPGAPWAETFVEEVWNACPNKISVGPDGKEASEKSFACPELVGKYGDANKEADPAYGYVFRARLAYPEKELAPGETAEYRTLSFTGPKERDLLAHIDRGHELLELGAGLTSFATKDIARGLVWYLLRLHGIVGSWGWAIVLLTVSVRMLVFPLSLSQIKSTAATRKLKPEMDAIAAKFKDDATQKGLAQQELMRKHGINPVLGCLPMLLTMPVWWALYTALQTAVELYHMPFGPVIPDLSAPGRYLIIPIVLGASSFLQQKLMPTQGDPQQQKMMMYMMPGIFTVMMLFLPAGLGVYMVTNSVLAIGQQLLVERYLKRDGAPPAGQIEVREKTSGGGGKPAPALGKGKARARG